MALGFMYAVWLTAKKFRQIISGQIVDAIEIVQSLPDRSVEAQAKRNARAWNCAVAIIPALSAHFCIVKACENAGERSAQVVQLIHALI